MTPSEMAKIAHSRRTPEERSALARKAQEAAALKYGPDRMKAVRSGKKLKACPCDDDGCEGCAIGDERRLQMSEIMDR